MAAAAAERRAAAADGCGVKRGGDAASSSRPSKGKGKGDKGSKGQGKGAGRSGQSRTPPARAKPSQADPLGIVATFAALKQMQPMLQSLGFGGAGSQRSRPKPQPGGKAAGEPEEQKKRTRGGKNKDPDAGLVIRDHEGKPAMVRNFDGKEVPIVSICYGCHWPYWSTNWSQCCNCSRKRDPIAWPEPKVFRHWLVKPTSADKAAGGGPGPALSKQLAIEGAPTTQQPTAAEQTPVETAEVEYPWEEELDEDAQMDDFGDGPSPATDAASAKKDLEEKAGSFIAMPSGLTPWWIRFLLKQGVTEATQWAKVMGVGAEIDLPSDLLAQKSLLQGKLAHLQASPEGGPDWSSEILAMKTALAKVEEGLASFAGEDEADPHANAKFADLLSKHLKAAEKEAEAATKNLANLEQQLKDLQQEIALKRRDSAAKADANVKFQIMLRKRVEGTSQNSTFARVLKEGCFRDRMQAKALETFSPEWKAQNGAALLSDEALYAFLTRAQSFWVRLAEDAVHEGWIAGPASGNSDQDAEEPAGKDGAEDEDML